MPTVKRIGPIGRGMQVKNLKKPATADFGASVDAADAAAARNGGFALPIFVHAAGATSAPSDTGGISVRMQFSTELSEIE